MNITTDLDGSFELQKHGLIKEDLTNFETDGSYLLFLKDLFLFGIFFETFDDFVEVKFLVFEHSLDEVIFLIYTGGSIMGIN